MDYPITFDRIKSRWSIVCSEGSHAKMYFCLVIDYVLKFANRADPDKMPDGGSSLFANDRI